MPCLWSSSELGSWLGVSGGLKESSASGLGRGTAVEETPGTHSSTPPCLSRCTSLLGDFKCMKDVNNAGMRSAWWGSWGWFLWGKAGRTRRIACPGWDRSRRYAFKQHQWGKLGLSLQNHISFGLLVTASKYSNISIPLSLIGKVNIFVISKNHCMGSYGWCQQELWCPRCLEGCSPLLTGQRIRTLYQGGVAAGGRGWDSHCPLAISKQDVKTGLTPGMSAPCSSISLQTVSTTNSSSLS